METRNIIYDLSNAYVLHAFTFIIYFESVGGMCLSEFFSLWLAITTCVGKKEKHFINIFLENSSYALSMQ